MSRSGPVDIEFFDAEPVCAAPGAGGDAESFLGASDDLGRRKATKKLRGISLLKAIYGELSEMVPEGSVTSEELLQASQKLIELSKKEYVSKTHSEGRRRPGYYSYDLCTAFDKYQGRILENEMAMMNDPLAGRGARNPLRDILNGSREDMILEEVYG